MYTNPDLPTTETEYQNMLATLKEYNEQPDLSDAEREDRAFLMFEVDKYEAQCDIPRTTPHAVLLVELEWWRHL
jgi:hypothetical protein